MNDYISREAARNIFTPPLRDPESIDFWEWLQSEIEAIPAADVREVVLCRDCDCWNDWDSAGNESLGNCVCSCPLVPVPPHGRLIDADELLEIVREYIDEYGLLDENGMHDLKWCAMKEAEAVIIAAPTIIPAEEEKP